MTIETGLEGKPLTVDEGVVVGLFRRTGGSLEDAVRAFASIRPVPEPTPEYPPGERFEDFDPTYAESRPLAVEVARRAAVELREAKERLRIANERESASPCKAHVSGERNRLLAECREWDVWGAEVLGEVRAAEQKLMAVIFLFNGERKAQHGLDFLKGLEGWPGASLRVGGELFAVGPDHEGEPVLVIVPADRQADDDDGDPDWEDD